MRAIMMIIFLALSQITFAQSGQGGKFDIGAGIWIPIGHLRNTFYDNQAYVAIGYGAVVDDFRYDLAFRLHAVKYRPFNFLPSDTSFVLKEEKLDLGTLGIRVSRVSELQDGLFFDKTIGLGISTINTSYKEVKDECSGYNEVSFFSANDNCNDSNKYKFFDIESFYISIGAGLRKYAYKNNTIGISMDYTFSPYSWFGRVENGFGNSAVTIGLSFRL